MIGHGPRSGKKLASVAVIIAVIVAAGAGGMVLGPKLVPKASAEASKKETDKKAASKPKDHKKTKPKRDKHEAEDEDVEAGDIVELGEFLVNLGGGSGTRYLRAEVSMRLSGLEAGESKHGKPSAPTLPTGDAAIARDRIVTVLSSGVFEQLRDNAGREKLKEQMLDRLHQALPAYEIHEVLFTAFVMQ